MSNDKSAPEVVERTCRVCSRPYALPLDNDPSRRCAHCGAVVGTPGRAFRVEIAAVERLAGAETIGEFEQRLLVDLNDLYQTAPGSTYDAQLRTIMDYVRSRRDRIAATRGANVTANDGHAALAKLSL